MKYYQKIFNVACILGVLMLFYVFHGHSEAMAACKALGYDSGEVNFNPRKSYYCRNTARYWFEDGKLVPAPTAEQGQDHD